MKNSTCFLIFFFLIINSIIFSQHNGWQNYTDSRNVTGVVSDGDDWWIATTGGLIKINMETGAKTVYNHANSGLPSNHLTCIDIDPNSDLTLWIGTVEGIAVYNRQWSWTVYDTTNTPIPSNHITSLDYHESNIVLIGTTAGAVLRSGGNWTVYDDVNVYINAVYVERINSLYVGSGGNVFHGDGLTWTNIEMPSGRNITSIKKDGSIYLWVSTYGEGVYSWDGYNWTNYDSYNSSFTSNYFTWLDIDEDNNLWTACYGELWKRSALGNWEYQYTETDLYVKNVLAVSNELLAVGCLNGFFTVEQPGVSVVNTEYNITNSPFEYANVNDGENGKISSICIDMESNNKYLSAGGQIYKFSDLNTHIFSERPFEFNYAIADIITDHYGGVWVCSNRANAISIRGIDSWTQYSNPDDNNKCLLWEQTSAASGILWVGGEYAGLKSLDDSLWTPYPYDPYGIRTKNIAEMVMDDNRNIWIVGSTLEKFNGSTTEDYSGADALNQQISTCIAKENNSLWIGARPDLGRTGGITFYDGTDFTNYYTENSDLPGNSVTKILVDNNGRKYVGTTEGLAVFNETNAMTVYTRENSGLPDNHVTDLDIDDDGNLWIGTSSGGLAILGSVNITKIEEGKTLYPVKYILEQNYPNPFNPTTSISYSLPNEGYITLSIYDVLGNEVVQLEKDYKSSGNYTYSFDASNLTSGVYFYRLITEEFVETKKMILLK